MVLQEDSCQQNEIQQSEKKTSDQQSSRIQTDVDGVYAWIIAMTSFVGHFLIYGVIFSSGVFYDMFREIFDGSSSIFSLIASLSTAFTFGFSPIPGLFMNKYGQQMITMIGGLVAGIGLIFSAYATNAYYLAASFGVVTGIGFGTAYLAFISIVPMYFVKYRSVALGLAVSGVGLGTVVYPPMIRTLVHSYGIRGALLITGGITMNICVCGALMRPPKVGTAATSSKESPKKSDSHRRHSPVILKRFSKISPEEMNSKKTETSSAFSNSLKGKTRASSLNLHIFKKVGFLLLCLNNFFFLFGLSIVYVHLTAYSTTRKMDEDAASMLVSIIGISNLVGRPCFGLFAKIRNCPRMLYAISFSLCGVVVVLVPLIEGVISLMILAAAFGFLSAAIGPLLPLILTDFLSMDLFSSAYGYLLVFEAVGSLCGPPASGWLFDVLQRYPPSFYLGGATIGAAGVMIFIPRFVRTPTSQLTVDAIILDVETGARLKSLCGEELV
ncbi:hypothetical protein LSH36_183g00043 [Paralvinella palmiformis]|uniref:Major facilitator superfamily (MFS) profile domain-containing protein n=1 Tax=Paralvinella palmiformis TaxID=53620 RepID=A0AAD9JRI3_9ANNE|nr:hypothetical protein LSH36_183g00043 [Paralvinella palmiformis]